MYEACRVEHDQHNLRVAGPAAADLLVGRVGGEAARVTDRGRVDARRLPEHALGAPEAAHADDQVPKSVRERWLHRRAEHGVALGDRHLYIPPGQRVGGSTIAVLSRNLNMRRRLRRSDYDIKIPPVG